MGHSQSTGCKDLPWDLKNECSPSLWTLGESASHPPGASGKEEASGFTHASPACGERNPHVLASLRSDPPGKRGAHMESHHTQTHAAFKDSFTAQCWVLLDRERKPQNEKGTWTPSADRGSRTELKQVSSLARDPITAQGT